LGGVSSGDARTGATGTLGVQVFDNETGEELILSNAHVFSPYGAGINDVIIQPGKIDGGLVQQDRIGTLLRWTDLNTTHEFKIDAAVAAVDDPELMSALISEIGEVGGWVEPQLDMEVSKSGRTTQLTRGIITDIDASLTVNYGIGKVTLTDLIVLTRLTSPPLN